MLDSICGENGGHGPSYLGVESCKTNIQSMMKYILLKLKKDFWKKSLTYYDAPVVQIRPISS
jgi:hypothetical protein